MNMNTQTLPRPLPTYCAYPWQQMIIDLTGEVVPCCFWSGYGNVGKPLGNTNASSLDEIWNNTAYQALRLANASGNLKGHPCHQCTAYSWSNGTYPPFSSSASWRRETGHCFMAEIPEGFIRLAGDSLKDVKLWEDGVPLAFPESLHEDIRRLGGGRYSVWGQHLYFSASDNSDPFDNGRRYELIFPNGRMELPRDVAESPSGQNIRKAREEYINGVTVMSARPTMISLISTADCNIDCPGCSQNIVRRVRVQHRVETVPDVLAHVPYLHQFIWHGGEPYLIKRFRQFIDNFRREDNPNLTFGFTSNGTMLTAKELDKLQKFPRINASISIDSFRKETFEVIREGADFDRVLTNALNAFRHYEKGRFVFSCGMIVCKSNFLELADNLKFAIENEIGLNLSPVLTYPVTEQLNVFEDFERESAGWSEQLDVAEAIVARAEDSHERSVTRVDPSGMVQQLRSICAEASATYGNTTPIAVEVDDPLDALRKMFLPGIIVYSNKDCIRPLAFCRLRVGQKNYQLKIPAGYLPDEIHWRLVHNLLEPHGVIGGAQVNDTLTRGLMRIRIPKSESVVRRRNIEYANYGETTPHGLVVFAPGDISREYALIAERDVTGDSD